MTEESLDSLLEHILNQYQQAFAEKIPPEESTEEDNLMLAFGLTQAIKATNKQYWGRELGKCWERLVETLCQQTCDQYQKAHDTHYDLAVGLIAIDTKYRMGSGDAKTLRGFQQNSQRLMDEGFTPVLLIVRNDNLPQAMKACSDDGWEIYAGNNAYSYLKRLTQFDLPAWLRTRQNRFIFKVKQTDELS